MIHIIISLLARSLTLSLFVSQKGQPHPPPRSARVGEIGWGVTKHFDEDLLKNDNQIKVRKQEHIMQMDHFTFLTFGCKLCTH